MRRDDGRCGEPHRIERGLLRAVRDVDHQAEPVHARDRFGAERADARRRGRIAERCVRPRRAREVVVAVVDEPDVAGAKLVVAVEHLEVAAERVAVLDADRRDELARGSDARNVGRRIGELDAVRVELLGHAVDGGELGQRVGLRASVAFVRASRLADEHDEEAGVETAGRHLRQIDLQVGRQRIGRGRREVERYVDVRIESQRTLFGRRGRRGRRWRLVRAAARERREARNGAGSGERGRHAVVIALRPAGLRPCGASRQRAS